MRIIYLANRWPNPSQTAAGTRSLQLLQILQAKGHRVTIASFFPADTFSQKLEQLGFECKSLELNDSNTAGYLRSKDFDIAVFDTFLMEEKLSWMVRDAIPGCMTILDTQDLHFLRYARSKSPSFSIKDHALDLNNPFTYREIASIYRCDLTLVISLAEMKLLQENFHIDPQSLFYLPFLYDDQRSVKNAADGPNNRKGLMLLGNFLHQPNLDQVKFVIQQLSAHLQEKLPNCTIKIIGAYPPQHLIDLTKNKKNIELLGYQDDLTVQFAECRMMIAPLRFGAGLKGKLFDAMLHQLPFIASEVAAEGVLGLNDLYIAKCEKGFIDKLTAVYSSGSNWEKAQNHQHQLLSTHFQKSDFEDRFTEKLEDIRKHLQEHRNKLFYQNFLNYHQLQSTKYFSKWIELKNRSQR
jgi:glycosyltransferase involved in cell wall biosynthesis